MRRRRLARTALILAAAASMSAIPAAAQDQPAGIRLGAPYNTNPPLIAVRPFAGAAPAAALDSMSTIIGRDLDYSNRFSLLSTVPAALRTGTVDYAQWNGLNVVYLVTGEVAAAGRGYTLTLTAHDVVYNSIKGTARFNIPPADDPDFRMAMHALSDEVVRWTLNRPGSAATRIAMSRQNGGISYDLLIVDSDGHGLRRLTGTGNQLYSPSWSPDGRRIIYASNSNQGWVLIERNIRDGSQRTIAPGGEALWTPVYAPDGQSIVLTVWQGSTSILARYNVQDNCCLSRISGGRSYDDMYATFSGDGRRVAFMSTRVGNPQVYVMPAGGGSATLVTPGGRGSEYTAPSWSPTDSKIAFHGRWSSRTAGYQLLVADADRPGNSIEQITSRGNNEDPSWAPDGRHLVYTSVGAGADGLYIVDVESKERRLLAPGGNLRMSHWSPPLLRAADLVVR